jgi:acetyl/propionyl-CoA carboxylase alpha subunit
MTKILIANRGEIALRIMKTARAMGLRTIAVYSDADAHALHVLSADEAVYLGPSEPSASYLNGKKIIDVAKSVNADLIHPGYGFLSERSEFAHACECAGIKFVGPPASAMNRLGDKIQAKRLAQECGLPVAPGYFEPGATVADLKSASDKIGYPVMLKASAGGGGRGMRVVREAAEFDSLAALASEEAVKAFGDGALMVEKYLEQPRHVEVQFLTTSSGETLLFFERECSMQRRHQKLIEEAPFSEMTEEHWQRLTSGVRRLSERAEYRNAGTVEFMFDPKLNEFYFLEVNTRLQVEHPVTEAICGVDLVQLQILTALGEPLHGVKPFEEADRSAIRGHAIEARIVAEDPAKGFLPAVGTVRQFFAPTGPGVRVDSGIQKGSEVSQYYDSLLAKLIVHASDRNAAIEKMVACLDNFHLLGLPTNIGFLGRLINSNSFRTNQFHTKFVDEHMEQFIEPQAVPKELAALVHSKVGSSSYGSQGNGRASSREVAWAVGDHFRNVRLS